MKKIFTIILVAAGTIGSASAQSNYQKSMAYNGNKKMKNVYRQPAIVVKPNNINYNDASFYYKEKEAKMAHVNHKFDQKIVFIKNDRHLNGRQKAKQIQLLQNQRKSELSKVDWQYAKSSHTITGKTSGHDAHKW